MRSLGIRALWQSGGRQVKRAAARETVDATDRGRRVARRPLVPGHWERFVAAGQATDTTIALDPRTIVPTDSGVDVSARLVSQRAGER